MKRVPEPASTHSRAHPPRPGSERHPRTRPVVFDFLLSAVILFGSFQALWPRPTTTLPARIKIYQENQYWGERTLDTEQRFWVGSVELEIHQGAVRVRQTDCPQGLCQHSGWIRKKGSSLICVPNKIVVEITGESGAGEYDVITY